MREDLLHYIWMYGKFSIVKLRTTTNEPLHIIEYGNHNKHSGPDFQNARVEIDGQIWAGNVEIHIKSSDWYQHGHHKDPAYDNVILHVVWEDDKTVYRASGEPIGTLILQDYVAKSLIGRFNNLLKRARKKFINCESYSPEIVQSSFRQWRLVVFKERLREKIKLIRRLFLSFNKDWERLAFVLLLRNFGQSTNTSSFLSLGCAIDYPLIGRLQNNPFQLECLLFGMAGLLRRTKEQDDHFNSMHAEYHFLKTKYNLIEERIEVPEFMGVRPAGFPTIRLSQFAMFYSKSHKIFHQLIEKSELSEFYDLFNICASDYWSTHYTFGKSSPHRAKNMSKTLIDNIIANTILPLKKFYALEYGMDNSDEIIRLAKQMKPEQNSIVRSYKRLGFSVLDAMDSQSLVHLNKTYCEKNRCLECAIGRRILN